MSIDDTIHDLKNQTEIFKVDPAKIADALANKLSEHLNEQGAKNRVIDSLDIIAGVSYFVYRAMTVIINATIFARDDLSEEQLTEELASIMSRIEMVMIHSVAKTGEFAAQIVFEKFNDSNKKSE